MMQETLTIRYRDAEGKETSRRITVLERSRRRDGDTYLRAYCHLRGEERTFLASRILGEERDLTAPPVAAVPVPAPSAGTSAPARRGGGGRFLLLVGIIAVAAWWMEGNDGRLLPTDPVPVPSPAPSPAPRPVPAPSPPPVPSKTDPSPPRPAPAGYQTIIANRIAEFTAATGISDVRVISRYASADTDNDGKLTWDELRLFQRKLVAEFPYRTNPIAYSPTDFVSHGSGDCEDFALFTCGLLRFWGIDSYLGSLQTDGSAVGHAIALVKVTEVPRGFSYYEIDASFVAGSPGVPPGIYVPVDYDHVGGLSNAVGPGWTLRWMRTPETAYGLPM
ncbi:MAG: WYL domain-containing protein [Spirochaetaceae bacterium]